jgi:hypothetical protein
MNLLLWILQILLALWNLMGAGYMISHYQNLANAWALSALPKPIWVAYGVLEALFALGLLMPKFISRAAVGLAVLVLLGCGLFTQYTGVGLLWAFVPALLLVFVAYKRKR